MFTRPVSWIAAGFLLAGLVWAAPPASLDFVHISDTHVSALAGVHPDIVAALKAKSSANQNLKDALQAIAATPAPAPDFILATGDLVEGHDFEGEGGARVAGQVEVFASLIRGSRVPVYPGLGNHDLSSYKPSSGKPAASLTDADRIRKDWAAGLPGFRDGVYYSFRRQVGRTPYLFLVLDNGKPEATDADYVARQMTWLKEQLAAHRNGPIVVAMHLPLPSATHGQRIRETLAEAPNVALLLAGHRHSNAVESVELGSRKVTQVRTAAMFLSGSNWRKLRLLEDRIEVFATGKADERQATIELAPMAMTAGAGR